MDESYTDEPFIKIGPKMGQSDNPKEYQIQRAFNIQTETNLLKAKEQT